MYDKKVLSELTSPSAYSELIALIEECFDYPAGSKFETDFFPLVTKENLKNLNVLVDKDQQILAHVGVKIRQLKVFDKTYSVALLGGLCSHPQIRGKGIFKKFLSDVLEKYKDDVAFFFLFSDQKEFYNRFGFVPVISQFQIQLPSKKKKNAGLSIEDFTEREKLKHAFHQRCSDKFFYFERSEQDWEDFFAISSLSIDHWVSANGEFRYAIFNKGADLGGVIHETNASLEEILERAPAPQYWFTGPGPASHDFQLSYLGFMRIGSHPRFTDFIKTATQGRIKMENGQSQRIQFKINNQRHTLGTKTFLQGVFGPEFFKEIALNDSYLSFFGADTI